MADQSTTSTQAFLAFERLKTKLSSANMAAETVTSIIDKMKEVVVNTILKDIAENIDDVTTDRLQSIADEKERAKELNTVFKAKTGKTIDELREEIAEDMVKQFEALPS